MQSTVISTAESNWWKISSFFCHISCISSTYWWSLAALLYPPLPNLICLNGKMYLCKWQNVVVQIAKFICPNCSMYLSKLQNVFVQIAKWICPNCKMYLSKLQNVFVQLGKCREANASKKFCQTKREVSERDRGRRPFLSASPSFVTWMPRKRALRNFTDLSFLARPLFFWQQ